MLTAIQLIFAPFRTWEKISLARRGVVWVLLVSLLPLLLASVAVEGYSLIHWGEKRGGFSMVIKASPSAGIRYSVTHAVLLLSSVVIGAKFLQWVTQSFQIQTSFAPCFSVMAYGFSPIFLGRFLDAVPALNTWVCWGLGALLSISVLYHGIGLVLRPEQTKGFGIYLFSAIMVTLSSLLSHFIAVAFLYGRTRF